MYKYCMDIPSLYKRFILIKKKETLSSDDYSWLKT